MEYAVIRTGGKQYRVAPGEIIRIERLAGEPGTALEFTDVLLTASNGSVRVGSPVISGARVTAEIIEHTRAKKILVFKKKRRKNYRRRQGHRQHLTAVRVTAIEIGARDHGA